MESHDGRKFSREAQAERRRLAVVLTNEHGFSALQVATMLGVNQHTVWRWLRRFEERGDALFTASERRGHAQASMTPQQVAWLVQTVSERDPRAFGAPSPVWTIELMRAAVAQEFSTDVAPSTLHRHARRGGLRPRSPRKQATERDDAEVDRWMKEVWPTVRADAANGSVVAFLDEAQVRADSPLGTSWSKKGVRPVVRATGKRPRINIVSAITWDGRLVFQTYNGSFDGARFIGFLGAMVAWAKCRPLTIVLDGLRVHFAKEVRAAVEANGWKVRMVQLPAYAPDLNPDEHVWSYLKGYRMRRNPMEPDERIEDVVRAEMADIALHPELVRSFFQHPAVHYLHHDAANADSCSVS